MGGALAVAAFAASGLPARAMTLLGGGASAPAPTIVSERPDYPPGATVRLSGSGWAPGELVHIVVNDDQGQTWRFSEDVIAAADGAIAVQLQLPDRFVALYGVTATGPTSGTATSSFTDATAVTSVAAMPSSSIPGHLSSYTTAFTTTQALAAGDNISVAFPPAAGAPSSISASNVTVNGATPTAVSVSGGPVVGVTLPTAIAAGAAVTVVVGSASAVITNPPAGTYTLTVKTTSDRADGISGSFLLDTPPSAGVVLSPRPAFSNDALRATATPSDADGGAVSLTYVWTVNGATVKTTTGTAATTDTLDLSVPGNGDKGQTVAVQVTPLDAFGVTGAAAADSLAVTDTPPSPAAQSVSLNEDATKTMTLSASDADGDAVAFSIASGPSHGSVGSIGPVTCSGTAPATCRADVTYTPATFYYGADSFQFAAGDGTASGAATVGIDVVHVNHPPTAAASILTTPQNTALPIALAGNDVDLDSLSFSTTSPSHGSLSAVGTPTCDLTGACTAGVTYTPTAGYVGSAGFSYTVSDGHGGTSTATVSIDVTYVDHAPVATPQTATLNEDSSTTIALAGTDADGDPLTFAIATLPARGTLGVGTHTIVAGELPYTLSGTSVDYIPNVDLNGSDSFTFVANDGRLNSSPASASMTVRPVNDAPLGNNTAVTLSANGSADFDLSVLHNADGSPLVKDVETPNANLTYTIVTHPSKGTVTARSTPGYFTYTPNPGTFGIDTATYRVTDRGDPDNCGVAGPACSAPASSAIQTITFAVTAPNPPPLTQGLQAWYDADVQSQGDGQPVASWTDGSGWGRDLSAAPGGEATMHRSALNGHAAVEFDGVRSILKTYNSSFTIQQPDTFFIVYRSADPNTSARAFVFDSTDSSTRQVFGRPGQGQARLYANIDMDTSGVSYPFSDYELWSGTFNGTQSQVYENGNLLLTGNAGGSPMSGLALGGLSTTGSLGYDMSHSYVSELLVYSGALTDAQRQSVTNWLNQKYSVIGPPTAPVNRTLPALTGSPVQGQTLTATTGGWGGASPITYASEIRRCDSTGANCVAVATASTYTIGAADVGYTFRVAVTATNTVGSTSAVSVATSPVTPAPVFTGDAPPVTANLQMWFDAGHETYAAGAPVTRWTDLSGFGRDLTSFDTGAAPLFRPNAVNGRPALEFDGSHSLLKTYGSTFTINQPDTYFIVYRQLDGREAYIYDSTNSSVRQLFGRGPFGDMEMYANSDLTMTPIFPFPGYELWSGTYNGTASTLYQNGTLVANGNAGASSLSGLTVGGLSTSAQFGYNMSHSFVSEILWYSGALSAAERQSVTTWLNGRYAFVTTRPTATLAAPTSATSGTAVTISLVNGQGSSTELHYAFSCDGSVLDAATYATASATSSTTCTFPAGTPTQTIRARVISSDDQYTEYTQAVAVTDPPPTATLTAPDSIFEGAPVHVSLDGATSVSAQARAAGFTYAFDCGGSAGYGAFGTVNAVDCPTVDNGSVTVRATVKDTFGRSTEYTKAVTIQNAAPVVTTSTPQSGSEGSPTLLSLGSFTDAGVNDRPWQVAVDWGDGTPTATFAVTTAGDLGSLTHTYADSGSFTAHVFVTDKDAGLGAADLAVGVANVAPTATLSDNGPVAEGSPATVTFSGVSDPSPADTAAGFRYSFACDGSSFGAIGFVPSTSCMFADNGVYTVAGRVYDQDGGFSRVTTQVHVTNVAPTATFAAGSPIAEGSASTLSLAGAFDPSNADTAAGLTQTYSCDGTTFTVTASCTFADNGVHTVYGRIADKDGGATTYNRNVVVNNVAPTVTAPSAQTAAEGGAALFSLGSFVDPGTADTWQVLVGWGDATTSAFGAGAAGSLGTLTHTFRDNGSYTVTVTVTDKDGGAGSQSFLVSVANVLPTATFTATSPLTEGSSSVLSLTNVFDPSPADTAAGLATTYSCNGTTFTATPSCTFADNGTYTVYGRIADKDGGSTTYSASVTVTNVAPVATFAAASPVNEGSASALSLTNVFDPSSVDTAAGLTRSYSCDGTAYTGTASCTFADNGTYTVYGRIADKDGGANTYTASVTVNNVAPTATFTAASPVNEGSASALSLTNVFDPSSVDTAAVLTRTYSCDGTTYSATASCTFADNGTYTVYGRIADKDGGANTYTASVTVNNVAPTATFAATSPVDEGYATALSLTTALDPSAADTAAGFTRTYSCDGTTYTATPSCAFGDNGVRTVYGRIADKDGGATTYSAQVSVRNVVPSVTAPSAQSASEGSAALFSLGSFTDPGAADAPWHVVVAWGDATTSAFDVSTTGSLAILTHTYQDNGSDTVTVTVNDKDGGAASKSFTVSVANVAPTATFAATSPVGEGSSTLLSLTSAFDPSSADTSAGFIRTYSCDGTTYTSTASCTFADNGTYTVYGRVADKDGGATTYSASVTVTNVAPTATFAAASPVAEGSASSLSLTSALDPSSVDTATGFTRTYSCDGTTYTSTASCTFADNGSRIVYGRITDKDGGSSTYSATVTVTNVAPTATFAATSPVAEGSPSTLSLTSAFDPSSADTTAGFTRTYSCDGTTYTSTVSCTFADNGTYTVYGRIADKDGGANTYNATVTVNNVAPFLTAPAGQSANEGATATFALGLFTDAGAQDNPWAVDVTWGDGTTTHFTTAVAGAISSSHAFLRSGSYTVSVIVTDKDSAVSIARTFAVAVTNLPPALIAPFAQVGTEGTAAPFALGSFSDPGSSDGPWTVDVNWGDGTAHTTFPSASAGVLAPALHTYADNGTYTVTESVTDLVGASDTKTFGIAVSNAAPTLTAPAAQSGNEGQPTLFSLPSFADLGANDAPWSVDVNWGDGTAHTTFQTSARGALGTLTHSYADSGSFTAAVTVTDKDGGVGTTTFAVTMANVAPTGTLGAIGTLYEGTAGTIGFSAQYDPSTADTAAGFTYTYACDGVHFSAATSSATASCTFADNGTYTVSGTISDKNGGMASYTAAVTVTNVAPTATFAATSPVAEGSATALSLTSPFDPSSADMTAGFSRTYSCDGTTYTAVPSCSFADNGTYTVSGRIVDKDGGVTTYVTSVTVTNVAPTATFAATSPVPEGSATTLSLTSPLDPSSADTSAGFTRTYSCNGTTFAAAASCTFGDNGTYTVYGRIADKDGGATTYNTTVTVANVVPALTAASGQSANEGADTSFALGSFSDPGAADAPWTVNVNWGDTSSSSFTAAQGAISRNHTFADNGSYTVTTTVSDKDGGVSAVRTFVVTVANVVPSLTAPAAQSSNEGSAKAFDLGSYTDPGATDAPWSVDVNWGDGSAHSTFASSTRGALGSLTHTYDDNGSYTMAVRVTDKDGGTSISTSTVAVANVVPTATFNAPASVNEGSPIGLSLTGATDPSGADMTAGFTYAFDCGSGYGSFGAASIASCATSDNGTRTVKGEIRDKDGGISEYTRTVTIDNVNPTVTTANQNASEGSAATLSLGSFLDPGPDNPWSVDVAWGDGSAHYAATSATAGSLGSQAHTYADSGSYTVTVKVTDKDGGIGTSSYTVTVANVAPTSSLPATANGYVNAALVLSFGAATDPSVPDTTAGFHYAFDCNNGSLATATYTSAGTSNATSCTSSTAGTYTVRGRIIDKDGGFNEYTTVVTVTNAPPIVTFATGNTTSIPEGTAAATQYTYNFTIANGATITGATAGCGTLGTLVAASLAYTSTSGSFKCTFNTADGTPTSVSTVTANVTRNDGATGAASLGVAIANVAPVPAISTPTAFATYLVNANVILSGSFTDPGPDASWKVHIDWGDNTVTDLTVATKSYSSSHVYHAASPNPPNYTTITVTVTDKDGGAGTVTRIIYVR